MASDAIAVTPKTMNSMTLAISHENATRMLEASRSLNAALDRLQAKHEEANDMLHLIDAAKSSDNPLLKTHVNQMQHDLDKGDFTKAEMRTCLLIFLDIASGKSSKLLHAFQELSRNNAEEGKGSARVGVDTKMSQSGHELQLGRNDVMKLFRCFLLSISTCIHYDDSDGKHLEMKERVKFTEKMKAEDPTPVSALVNPKVSPEMDSNGGGGWTLSNQTRKNIQEIANYATDKVILYASEKLKNASLGNHVTFTMFGEWYNSGGFSLVPWLELLDLAKWHYAGRAAEKALAAEKAIEKHHARNAQPNRSNCGMEPIMENFVADPFNSPHPHLNSPAPPPKEPSQPPLHTHARSEPVATFELAGRKEHTLFITEENLSMFQDLVERSGLYKMTPNQISEILLGHSKPGTGSFQGEPVIYRKDLPRIVRDLVPNSAASTFSQQDMERFSVYFSIFFLSHSRNLNGGTNFHQDIEQANARELAVGFSFLCAGNKSQKLDETFKIMSEKESEYMTHHNLMRFTRSYLRMLVGISLISSSSNVNLYNTKALLGSNKTSNHIAALCRSADIGSKWILDNFLHGHKSKNGVESTGTVSFEDFASWYTEGGYKLAPWLEFLDHKKFVGLLRTHKQRKVPPPEQRIAPQRPVFLSPSAPPLNPPTSSGKVRSFDEFIAGSPSPHPRSKVPRSSHLKQQAAPEQNDILSTFPLSNGRNLIVLREDAAYVRLVVEQFGLLQHTPSTVWTKMYNYSKKNSAKPLPQHQASIHKSGHGKCRDVNQKIFVEGVLKSIPAKHKRKRSPPPLAPTPKDTLNFFFLSFDIKEVDRVAINQLMGGLTLLCGGSKTSKLSFAFNLFDGRFEEPRKKKKSEEIPSLCGKEVFYFLRSILIVLFSCCRQSLDLTAGPVGSYIADAANMVTNDIMKYQWRARKVERINFDEFGEWYNEGGFEVAPWLELLDLNKWAFLDKEKAEKMISKAKPMKAGLKSRLKDNTNKHVEDIAPDVLPEKNQYDDIFSTQKCPPAPADEDFDSSQDEFFGADMGVMEDIDSFDVDFFDQTDQTLMKDNMNALPNISLSEPEPLPVQSNTLTQPPKEPLPLTFRLSTSNSDHHTISIPPKRANLLKSIIVESGLHEINIATLCDKILGATHSTSISKAQFNVAMTSILGNKFRDKMGTQTNNMFNSLLFSIYDEFDTKKVGKADAGELACGLTILCGGRKSDKLEYAFEVLDKMKNGMATRSQMIRYLHSFLTVLLHISSCSLGDEGAEDILYQSKGSNTNTLDKRLVGWVSSWATDEVFKATPVKKIGVDGTECINFDYFADWYTKGGYNSIAWLELLDLKKWILSNP